MDYAQRLRDLREDHDFSQEYVAKIMGTSQSYYAQYENGKRSLPFERAIFIARFYNVSLDYLAGLIDVPRTLTNSPYRVSKNITIGDINNTGGSINIKN